VSPQQTDDETGAGRASNPSSFWMAVDRLGGASVPGREADNPAMRVSLDVAQDGALLPVESLRATRSVGIGPCYNRDLG
jgi:hypothetical protein